MNLHANVKLGLAGRRELVLAIELGASLRSAAAAFGVSPATAHRWWHRSLGVGVLVDRCSRPRRQPRRLSAVDRPTPLRGRRPHPPRLPPAPPGATTPTPTSA